MRKYSSPISVLIVEDEMIPAEYLKSIIEASRDFEVIGIVPSASEAFDLVKKAKPEIIFMDIMLKGATSGAELALRLHQLYAEMVIVFMTAYSTEEMVAYAVESDAFAYLLKPYRPKEIKATLSLAKARLGKTTLSPASPVIALVDGFSYDTTSERLYRDGEIVVLTPHELQLIQILCRDPNNVVDKAVIQNRLQLSDTALRSLVYRVRKITAATLIQSVKRFGYRITTA